MIGNVFNGEKKVLINTKIGNLPFYGKSFELDDLKKSLDQSLKRLRSEKINILFLHNPRLNIKDYKKIINFMKLLKKQKIIKLCGISLAKNYSYDIKTLNEFDVIQDDANLLSVGFQKYRNFKIYGRSPYANGILTGSLMRKFSKDDHRSAWLNNNERKKIISYSISQLKKFSKLNIKELAFFFVNANSNISKNIFGVKNKGHIDDIILMLSKKTPENIDYLSKKILGINQINFGVSEKHVKSLF